MARARPDRQAVLAQHVAQALGAAGGAEEQDRRALAARGRGERAQVARVTRAPAGWRRWAPRPLEVDLAQVQRRAAARRRGEILGRHQRLRRLQRQRVRAALRAPRARARGRLRPPRRPSPARGRPSSRHRGRPGRDGGAGDERQQVREVVDDQAPRSIFSSRAGRSRWPAKRSGSARAQRRRARERGAKTSVRGQDLEGVERGRRALRLGIEAAQRLHGVAEELDADGRVAIGREDVEDSPAARDLAGGGDRVLAAVSAFVEHLEQDLRRHLVARRRS